VDSRTEIKKVRKEKASKNKNREKNLQEELKKLQEYFNANFHN
jgi:hypothetical protein